MDKHDFSEFYEIGGLLIEAHVKELIQSIDYNGYEDLDGNTNECVSYLLALNDAEFREIYINMPRDIESYQSNEQMSGLRYNYFTYMYAYVSNMELMHRCFAISKIPILNSIIILTTKTYCNYIDISKSYKILRENGCDVIQLLHIVHNYEAIKYLIDSMTEFELYLFLTKEHIYSDLVNILIIDKIYSTHDEYLISILNSHEIDHNEIDHNGIDYNQFDCNQMMIMRCYKIIKYLTVIEGKTLMTNINKYYESRLHKIQGDDTRSNDLRNIIKTEQSLHNELLVQHFTPRGSHTKGAFSTF
jgi:hypothetical protein